MKALFSHSLILTEERIMTPVHPKALHVVYFSPTGGTRRVARRLLAAARTALPGFALFEHDLTLPEDRSGVQRFGPDAVVLFAVPVYFGRMPAILRGFRGLAAEGAVGVPVAVYGNRHYDDALRELGALMTEEGFTVAAGAAFIARHSQWPSLGAGRPDDADEALMGKFLVDLAKKLKAAADAGDEAMLAVKLPGEGEMHPYGVIPTPPRVLDPKDCCRCGSCAEKCPAGIIDPMDFTVTEPEECLGCRACITACPNGARNYPEPFASGIAARMAQIAAANTEPKKPEVFL